MGRVVKVLLWLVGAFAALFVLAAIALYLFFDPNDFREEISNSVKNQTGRDLVIEGDISLDLFPWLAIEVGQAHLGNAPGFGDEPMVSFERASFSVRLLPAILRREIEVGAANIESLRLNLMVDDHGGSNWSDLISGNDDANVTDDSESEPGGINANSINVVDAMIRYTDEEAGETIVIDGMNLNVGRLHGDGSAVPFNANLNFELQPAGLSGAIELETVVAFDTEGGVLQFDGLSLDGTVDGIASIPTRVGLQTDGIEVSTAVSEITLQTVDLTVLDMHIVADVQPISYAGPLTPKAVIAIDAFSPRTIMTLFDVEPPETADPSALSLVIVDATAELAATSIELTDVVIKMDDTSFTGTLSVPSSATGSYQFDLVGDAIDLARYMEPSGDNGDDPDAAVPVEIPVDLIKPLNARGKFQLRRASLGKIIFENIDVGLNSSGGKMRVFPISSEFFGGSYSGDVRIDVSGAAPTLSMDEKIANVDLARLAKAMFDQENVTGSIEGSFVLAGRGSDMATIQRDLSGDMSMELTNGSFAGTDVWYELRRARALFKGEEAPEPVLPAKTDFSTVRMTGTVTDGVLSSDDLFAELPFMQLTGGGEVDIPAGTVDYGMTARILERPEFLQDATPEELEEFTEAVIPLRITGSLTSPSVKPDLEKLLQQRVEDEIKDQLKDKLKDLFD
jgi:AsmA protein